MIFSRSSTAIWCVSRSESLDKEVMILCLSSIMAKCEDREDEVFEDVGEGVDGGFLDFKDLVVAIVVVVIKDFLSWEDLGG